MRILAVALLLCCSGCASYMTPGGPVRLGDIDHADGSDAGVRQPSQHFPANIAVIRVQASQYKSLSIESYGEGRFSVITPPELLTDAQVQALSKWPAVSGVSTIDRFLLPTQFKSLDDLRLAAAKVQADVLLIYTVDTSFQIQGHDYGPSTAISLGLKPDEAASVTANASAVFTDVRTGFIYSNAQASAKLSDLAAAWSSSESVDQKRLQAERQAFTALVSDAANSWADIVKRYQ